MDAALALGFGANRRFINAGKFIGCCLPLYLFYFLMEAPPIRKYQTLLILATACLLLFIVYKTEALLWLCLLLSLIGLFSPVLSTKIDWIWMKFAELLGFINSRILLTLTFFLVLTPIALLYRLAGKSKLQLNKKKEGSYYTVREHLYKPGDLTKPW